MSKSSNLTVIGAFVLGAVLLLVVAALLFGGSALFASKRTLVSYFPGSVKGLREGSSVALNGVRVGYVKDLRLQGEIKPDRSMAMLVMVTMEVVPARFELLPNGTEIGTEERLKLLSPEQYVKAGIRAKLGTESIVTGQLLVSYWSSSIFDRKLPPCIAHADREGPPKFPRSPAMFSRSSRVCRASSAK